jgi:hypothetical protein
MKRLLLGAMLWGAAIVVPISALAGVDIIVSVPPPIVFAAPPEVVVIPETYVYVVPDLEEDIFFYSGWWWRPWQGRWYRSRDYSSGWVYYRSVPSFYTRVPSGWRTHYREHRWGGHPWNYQRIPHQQLQHNWRGWEKRRHWEKQNTWGVEGLKSRPQSRESIKSQKSREGKPQSQDRVKSRKSREAKPQPHETVETGQSREGKPQSQDRVKSRKSREAKPQSHEARPHGEPE